MGRRGNVASNDAALTDYNCENGVTGVFCAVAKLPHSAGLQSEKAGRFRPAFPAFVEWECITNT
jgi:hypothetical protein